MPIVDLAARLGFASSEPTARHAVIVVQVGDQIAGLLVDTVSDIANVSPSHPAGGGNRFAGRARSGARRHRIGKSDEQRASDGTSAARTDRGGVGEIARRRLGRAGQLIKS